MAKTLTFLEYLENNYPEFYEEGKKKGLISKVAHVMGKMPITAKVVPLALGTMLGAKGLEVGVKSGMTSEKPNPPVEVKNKKPEKPKGIDKGRFERPSGADA